MRSCGGGDDAPRKFIRGFSGNEINCFRDNQTFQSWHMPRSIDSGGNFSSLWFLLCNRRRGGELWNLGGIEVFGIMWWVVEYRGWGIIWSWWFWVLIAFGLSNVWERLLVFFVRYCSYIRLRKNWCLEEMRIFVNSGRILFCGLIKIDELLLFVIEKGDYKWVKSKWHWTKFQIFFIAENRHRLHKIGELSKIYFTKIQHTCILVGPIFFPAFCHKSNYQIYRFQPSFLLPISIQSSQLQVGKLYITTRRKCTTRSAQKSKTIGAFHGWVRIVGHASRNSLENRK